MHFPKMLPEALRGQVICHIPLKLPTHHSSTDHRLSSHGTRCRSPPRGDSATQLQLATRPPLTGLTVPPMELVPNSPRAPSSACFPLGGTATSGACGKQETMRESSGERGTGTPVTRAEGWCQASAENTAAKVKTSRQVAVERCGIWAAEGTSDASHSSGGPSLGWGSASRALSRVLCSSQ